MRTRDEVLREFGRVDPQWEEESIARMADRIRELEAENATMKHSIVQSALKFAFTEEQTPEAASEPVAWAADVIAHHLSYTNGWRVSDERYAEHCTQAAMEILSRLTPHPSAAGVTVTEAMVEAVVRFLYRHFDIILNRDGATKMLTAALTAASKRREEGNGDA